MSSKRRLVIGVLCAALAMLLVLVYAAQVRAEERETREEALARYGGEQVEVCVASRDIAAGEQLSASNVEVSLWLADLLPAECATSLADVEGTVAGCLILANEPISRQLLASSDGGIEVPTGLCAVSVPATNERAVGGAIARGSLVNVYATTDSGMVLLGEELLVLETSNRTSESQTASGSLAWVTLAVTPDSVQQLLEASRSGTIYLTLPAPDPTPTPAASKKRSLPPKQRTTRTVATKWETTALVYQGDKAVFGIDGTKMSGKVPFKQEKLIGAWAVLHEDEILANWRLVQEGHEPARIAPLR